MLPDEFELDSTSFIQRKDQNKSEKRQRSLFFFDFPSNLFKHFIIITETFFFLPLFLYPPCRRVIDVATVSFS